MVGIRHMTPIAKGTNVIIGFGGNDTEKTADKPNEVIAFTRQFPSDSVVFVQTPAKMEWQVYGTANKTYIWTYPTEQSTNTDLANILIDILILKFIRNILFLIVELK